MTLALALQTDHTRLAIALTIPQYRPSRLLGVIMALMGLAIDAVLFPSAIGTVGLWTSTIAEGIIMGLLALEVMRP